LLLALPSISAAATFTVTTPVDSETQGTACLGLETCSLRDAIRLANSTEGEDTIDFAATGEGTIELTNQLPAITTAVTIDGTSAPAYTDHPVVEINGRRTYETGLWVQESGEAVIKGLAIGGFHYSLYLAGAGHSRVCASWIGIGLDEASLGGSIGINIVAGSQENEIGVGCGTATAPNVIGDNTAWGVEDYGQGTEIGNSRVGFAVAGYPLPNQAGGIRVTEQSRNATIGGVGAGEPLPNVIAGNEGNGILVEKAITKAAIRGNSIFDNEGLGIEMSVGEGEAPPPTPTVESVTLVNGDETMITGTASGNAGEKVDLDFFANEVCDESGTGEGETYMGSASVLSTGAPAGYSVTVPTPPQAREPAVTATATGATTHSTTPFSDCGTYVPEARTLTVNTLEDGTNSGECFAVCSLRDAIDVSNTSEAEDTIDFSVAGRIEVEDANLPEINSPVEIDGTSAPGYAAVHTPVVLLDGSSLEGGGGEEGEEAEEEDFTEGLIVGPGGEGTVISGMAIGGFEYGVWLHAEEGSQICASYIGVEPDGTTALPNRIGLETGGGGEGGPAVGNELGAGCGSLGGNLISGNEEFGILDFVQETRIAGNRIGVDATGAPLPNGSSPPEEEGDGEEEDPGIGAGIVEAEEVRGAIIGGVGDSANPPNEIAYNDGPGILVITGRSKVRIRGNAIFSNEGRGIQYGGEPPALPTVEAVEGPAGNLTIEGQATGVELETIELDFFASALCEEPIDGEGERFLGSASVAGEPGSTNYKVNVPATTTADQPFVTVTATGSASDETSEFSECFRYVPPEPEPEPEPEPKHEETKQPTSTTNTTPATEEPIPTNGESVVVVPKEGTVLIKLPGTGKYVPLEELKEIPVGAIIDATKGKVTLTSIGPNGEEQTAVFFGGIFKVKQKEGSNVVVLELIVNKVCRGGMVKQGGTSASASSVATASGAGGKKGGKLWGSGHGSFKTEGNQGSATVRGTIWLVEDRCDGSTFFKTKRGVVTVNDFFAHKTLSLPAGKTYVAGKE
jgi:hypothetical protein